MRKSKACRCNDGEKHTHTLQAKLDLLVDVRDRTDKHEWLIAKVHKILVRPELIEGCILYCTPTHMHAHTHPASWKGSVNSCLSTVQAAMVFFVDEKNTHTVQAKLDLIVNVTEQVILMSEMAGHAICQHGLMWPHPGLVAHRLLCIAWFITYYTHTHTHNMKCHRIRNPCPLCFCL